MTGATAAPLSIIGLGNVTRGDDGAGVLIVEELREELENGAWAPVPARDIVLVPAGVDSLLAAAHAADGRWVILVDAAHMGLPAGEFRVFTPREARLSRRQADLAPHDADLAGTLRLVDELGCAERVRIVGIEAQDMAPGQALSAPVQASLPRVRARIKQEVGALP